MRSTIRIIGIAATTLILAQTAFPAIQLVTDLSPRGGAAQSVAVSPLNPSVVLAGLHTSRKMVHRSSDGGATFSEAMTFFVDDTELVGFDSAGRVFAASSDTLWVSDDTGVTLSLIHI